MWQAGEPPPLPRDGGWNGFLKLSSSTVSSLIRLYRAGLGRILRHDDVGDLAYSGFLTSADRSE